MDFDFQNAFNISVSLAGALGLFLLTSFRAKMDSLVAKDEHMSCEIHAIHVLVAGEYVKRTELLEIVGTLSATLCRIEEKIGNKADKVGQ